MQFHLLAFAPFIVLLGISLTAGAMSLAIKIICPQPKYSAAPKPPAAPPAASQHSAEIIYFRAAKARARTMTGQQGRMRRA